MCHVDRIKTRKNEGFLECGSFLLYAVFLFERNLFVSCEVEIIVLFIGLIYLMLLFLHLIIDVQGLWYEW